MTPVEIKLMQDLVRTIRSCASGSGILGPSALNLCSAVEVLIADHERVLALLNDARQHLDMARLTFVWQGCYRGTYDDVISRIDAELEGEK